MLRWKHMGSLLAVAALCTLLLPTAAPVSAQTPSRVTGLVINPDGNPFAGLALKLKNERGQTLEGKTDENGKYSLTLQPGHWSMSFYHLERMIWTLEFNLPAGVDHELPTVNFKEMIEKNPEVAAARKKQEEERNKFEAMKEHFSAGRTALDQAKTMERDMGKAPEDQRDSMKQQMDQLQQTAISEFQAAEKVADAKEPNRHLILANLGASYEAAGNYEQAADAFQRAIALKPEANYYVGLANSLARLGKVDEAGAACEKIAALEPANAATCWRNTGIVLYNTSKLKEAVTPLRRATELDPKNADAWYLLGASLLASMESKQVGDKLEFVVQPGTAEAYARYLELAPNGRFAGEAQAALQSLEALGAGVTTKVKVRGKKNN